MWPDNTANASPTAAGRPFYPNGGTNQPFTTGTTIGPLDELATQLESARERTTQSVARVKALADSLFGGEPEGTMGAKDIKPAPFGRLQSLTEQAQAVHFWLSELERQVSRLGPIG